MKKTERKVALGKKKTILVLAAVVAIAISGVSAYLLNSRPSVASSSSSYRWVVKFEQIYELQPIPYHVPTITFENETGANITSIKPGDWFLVTNWTIRMPAGCHTYHIPGGYMKCYYFHTWHVIIMSPTIKICFDRVWPEPLVNISIKSVTAELVDPEPATIETQVSTHINIYNPNAFYVNLTKQFVRTLPQYVEPGVIQYDGRTKKVFHCIPPNKGFEIDWEDILLWPPDPTNPYTPEPCTIKGFVIIECPFKLDVVAVYNKKTVDVINKITFHIRWDPPPSFIHLNTTIGTLKFNEPYELSRTIPWEPENITLQDVVLERLSPKPPPEPDDIDIEIVETDTYFDFLKCVNMLDIAFILRPTNALWERYWNETFGMPAPWPICVPLEICVKDTMSETLGATPKNRIPGVSAMLEQDLARRMPWPWISAIMSNIHIEIIEFDVAEGVGTGIDVEYIEPEII